MNIRGIKPNQTSYRVDPRPTTAFGNLLGETVLSIPQVGATFALPEPQTISRPDSQPLFGPRIGSPSRCGAFLPCGSHPSDEVELPLRRPSCWKRIARQLRLIDTGFPHARPMAGNRPPPSKRDGNRRIDPGLSAKDDQSAQSLPENTSLMSRIAYLTGKYSEAFFNLVQRLFSKAESDCETARLLLWDEILRDFEARFRDESFLQRESKDERPLDKSTLDLDEDAALTVKGTQPLAQTEGPEPSRPHALTEPREAPQAEPSAGAIAELEAWPTGGEGPAETEPWFQWISGVPDPTTGMILRAEEGFQFVGEALAASLYTLETLADLDPVEVMGPAVHVVTHPGACGPTGEPPVMTPAASPRHEIEWVSARSCQAFYSAAQPAVKESQNRPRTNRGDAAPFAFITSLQDVRHDAGAAFVARGEAPSVGNLARALAAILGDSEYDRVIGQAIATLIERGNCQAFRRLARLCESPGLQAETFGEPPDPHDGLAGKRKRTNTYRKIWER